MGARDIPWKLTSNQHRLIVTFSQHVIVSIIRNGEDMWRHFRLSLALVTTNNVIVIYWKPLVGIDCDTEKTRVLNKYVTICSKNCQKSPDHF